MITVLNCLRLGTAVNLISGFDPSWAPGDPLHQGIFSVPGTPLTEQDLVITPQASDWQLPVITVHDDASSLLSTLFPFVISNPPGAKEAEVAAGSLLIEDKDAVAATAALSAMLGIPLDTGYGYALITLTRISGTATHPILNNGIYSYPNPLTPDPALGVNEDFRKSLCLLRPALGDDNHFDPQRLTATQAQDYLALFTQWGTHFISAVSVGDLIFQVLCYRSDRYASMKAQFSQNDFSGYNAANFASLTTNANTGTHGFVAALGKIMCLSGDPAISASVSAGQWRDQRWTGGDSILAPLLNGQSGFNMSDLAAFTAQTALSYSLTTLSMFAETERRRAFRRVLKAALIQKFRSAVKPHFETYCPYDSSSVIPGNDVPGFVSNIATPKIALYTPRTDLGELQFVAGEITTNFLLSSNLLCSTVADVVLPGAQVSILCQEASFETDADFTRMVLSDAGFESYRIDTGKWYGCLQVCNTSGSAHETIVDGLLYRYGSADDAHGRFGVAIVADVRRVPDGTALPLLKEHLQLCYAFAASLLGAMGNDGRVAVSPTKAFVTETLLWLSQVIPPESTDIELLDLRVRALDAYRSALSPQYGAYVPLLPASDFQPQVDAIFDYVDAINAQIRDYQQAIAERKTQELVIDVGQALNANIVKSAQLLVDSIRAGAAQQRDLSGYYATLITGKKADLAQLNDTITKLQSSLDDQSINVGIAVQSYKTAVKDWEIRKAVAFALGVANGIFDIATSFAIPAGEIKNVAALGESVQALQKILNVLNNVFKAYTAAETTMTGILNAQSALGDLSGAAFDIRSNQQWDEMNVNMTYILNLGPSDDPEMLKAKLDLLKEFSTLVIRGKAVVSAKSAASQLAGELYNQQKQQLLSQRQQARLDALGASLEPQNLPTLDPLTLDLAGLTSSLVYNRSQLLSMLASTFVQQDQALQYQNLQTGTAITSFDLLSFKASVLKQAANTMAAKNRLNAVQSSVTDPIHLSLQVPVAQLVGGRPFEFSVQLDNSLFAEYVDARIISLDLALSGVVNTASGKYTVKLEFDGSPFMDRDPQRQPLTFRTPTRERTYEFQAVSNQPNYTDGGSSWSQDVNAITPFSTWRISIPATDLNQGITFSGTTATINLSFVLQARVVDASDVNRPLALALAVTPATGLTNAPSLQALVASMQGKSVLHDWDAVFSFSLDKIQQVLNKQFDELKNSSQYGGKINSQSCIQETQHVKIFKRFDLVYGYPKLSFSAADSKQASIIIDIESGSITSGSQIDSGPIEWDPPVKVDPGAFISATLPLAQESGIVTGEQGNNTLSVILSLAAGTFSANNMGVMNDDDKAAFNTSLISYFVQNPVRFIINTIDLHPYATLPDLQPSQFYFRTLLTPQNNNQMLQLFINTGGRTTTGPAQTFLIDVPEPIPIAADFSLMISSKIFFNSVLPASLNQGGWQIRGVDPGTPGAAWSGRYILGSVSIGVDLSSLNHVDAYHDIYGIWSRTAYTFSMAINPVGIGVTGLELLPAGRHVNLKLDAALTRDVNEHVDYTSVDSATNKSSDTLLSASFNIHLAADIALALSGTRQAQMLSFLIENTDVHPTGNLAVDGSWGCTVDVSDVFTTILRSQMPGPFVAQFNVSLKDISVFALKNLLFTDGNMISISDANIPGDLLLTGIIGDS